MAGVADAYTEFNATVSSTSSRLALSRLANSTLGSQFGGQPVLVRTLTAAPNNQKVGEPPLASRARGGIPDGSSAPQVWFRLPDGAVDGTGYAVTGYQTLRELWFGSIGTITNQPGTATYTLATLKLALAQIFAARQPSFVRTLDYMSDYDAGAPPTSLRFGCRSSLTASCQGTTRTISR